MSDRFFYLAGPISGQTEAEAGGWREDLIRAFNRTYYITGVRALNPLRGCNIATIPGSKVWTEARWPATLEYTRLRDFSDIDRSDVIVFGGLDAAQKVSIGSMIEWGYAIAKGKRIMVIDRWVADHTLHHNHPWLAIRDFTAHNIEDAARILHFYFQDAPFYKEPSNADRKPKPMEPGSSEPVSDYHNPMGTRVVELGADRKVPRYEDAGDRLPVAKGSGQAAIAVPSLRVPEGEGEVETGPPVYYHEHQSKRD